MILRGKEILHKVHSWALWNGGCGTKQENENSDMTIEKGKKAPDFTLKTKRASGIEDVKLSDNFGKSHTVLLFIPLAFTPVCTKEFCQVTSEYEQYDKLGAQVYGISVDSPFTLDAWAKASKMGITLLSDMPKEVIEKYGVLDKELLGLKGVAKRSAFVINKDGLITYTWVSDDPQQYPNFDEIKEALKREACAIA